MDLYLEKKSKGHTIIKADLKKMWKKIREEGEEKGKSAKYEAILLDEKTGDSWDIQLKATDDMSAIGAWTDTNPDTKIFVTEELSERMGLPSFGLSNEKCMIRPSH